MASTMTFAEVIDAIDRLSPDEQEALLEIVRRRVSEARRSILMAAVEEARKDHAAGELRVVTPSDVARDISE
jgi:hypothetical protein